MVGDVTVGLVVLALGIQLGPIHELRQSAPEHEGVGVKGVFIVLAAEEMLEDVTTEDVKLVKLVVAVQLVPMQTLKHNGPEQDGVSVLAVAMPDVMEPDPEDVIIGDVANGDVVAAGLDVHVGPIQRLKHSAPEQEDVGVPKLEMLDVLELDPADVMVDNVEDALVTGIVDKVLLVKLLIVVPGIVGLVTVLGVVDEHPAPTQIDTHNAPLQDVVKEDDKLDTLEVIDVEVGGSVVRVLGPVIVLLFVEVGHPEPTQTDAHKAPLQEHEVDNEVTDPLDVVDVKLGVVVALLDREDIELLGVRLVVVPEVLEVEVPKVPELVVKGLGEAEEIEPGNVDEAKVEDGVVDPRLEDDTAVGGLVEVEDVRLPPLLEVAIPEDVGFKVKDNSELGIDKVELCEVNEASVVEDMVETWLDEDNIVDELSTAKVDNNDAVEPIEVEVVWLPEVLDVEDARLVELGIDELGEVDEVTLVELCEVGDTNVVTDVAKVWLCKDVPLAELEVVELVEVRLVDI
ncbi:MAG: hypothetical protein Q9209_005844 [Squamulea sp. 1 TL-2023]